jgi:protein-disulfide isomerase
VAVTLSPPLDAADHVRGPDGAAHELVMFGDFQCPYCRVAQPQVHQVRRELGDRLRFAFRHFPLVQMHPMAEPAAEASESAAAQGNFWAYHDALYVSQPALSPKLLLTLAVRLGLDAEQLAQDLEQRRWRPRVARDLESGMASGVGGTPTFFVNGRLHQGDYDAASLVAALGATVAPRTAPRQSMPHGPQPGAPPPPPG